MSTFLRYNNISIIPDFGSEIETHIGRLDFEASVPPGQLYGFERRELPFNCESPFLILSTKILLRPIPESFNEGNANFINYSRGSHSADLVNKDIFRRWMIDVLALPACKNLKLRSELLTFFSSAWQKIPEFDDFNCSVTAVAWANSNQPHEGLPSKKGKIDADFYVTVRRGLLKSDLEAATNILINMNI